MTRWSLFGCVICLVCATAALADPPANSSRVPRPVVEPAKGGQCVADPAFMRRNHMVMLKHQRDDTLRRGNRTGAASLKACVACHVSPTSTSASAGASASAGVSTGAGAATHFCQSCHAYAAVKIDCFECHASTPEVKP